MSSKSTQASVVIEWAPGSVAAYDVASNKTTRGRSLAEIVPYIGSKDAVMAISRRACFVRTVNVPDASKSDLLQALTMSISQHVPIGSGDACVDIRLVNEMGPEGRVATLVAMKAADLRTLQDEAKQAGIRIIATVPAAYGSWLLASATSLKDCAAVSESGEGMNLDIISGGELRYSRALPPDASNGHLAPEILRTFSAAGLRAAPTLAEGLKIPTAEYTVAKSPLEALTGSGWSTPGVEFHLPETLLLRARSGRLLRARVAAMICILAVMLAGYVYMDRAKAQAAVDKAQYAANSSLSALRARAQSQKTESDNEAAMAAVLKRGFSPGQKLGDVIALVNNELPKNAWLTNVGVARGQLIVLRGTAMRGDDVATYVNSLSKEARLRNVKLIFANNTLIESTPVVLFSISAFPVGNLPLVDKAKKGGGK
jgi:hypothetical protein